MKIKPSNLLWGLVFIAVGICYFGVSFWSWDFNLFAWWPLFILIPSIGGLTTHGFRFSSLFGCFIGFSLLMVTLNLWDWDDIQRLFVPVILILVGISILFRDLFRRNTAPKHVEMNYTNVEAPEYSAIFSSQRVDFPNEVFRGTSINSIFGYVELNLRNAIITEDVVVHCTSIFAGADILVPPNVNVKVSSVPIFGGVSNKVHERNEANAPTIFVNATCMFGGLDIK